MKFSTLPIVISLVNPKKIELRNIKLDKIRTGKFWLQFQEIFIIQDNKLSDYVVCKDCLQAYKVYSTISNELKKSNRTSTIYRHVSNCTNKKTNTYLHFFVAKKSLNYPKKANIALILFSFII